VKNKKKTFRHCYKRPLATCSLAMPRRLHPPYLPSYHLGLHSNTRSRRRSSKPLISSRPSSNNGQSYWVYTSVVVLVRQKSPFSRPSLSLSLLSLSVSLTVNLSEEVFLQILDFLPTYDLVHRASLVSSMWLDSTRSPQMWNKMDPKHGLKARSKQTTTMTSLIQLLNRPQFAAVKKLVPPLKVRNTVRGLRLIAEACPLLEEIEIGYDPKSKMGIRKSELLQLPSLFPHLAKVNFSMNFLSNDAVVRFAETMAGRLVQLHISGVYQISDSTLESIVHHCPYLESFHHIIYQSLHIRAFSSHASNQYITEQGVIALVRGCPNLKSIALHSSRMVGLGAFEHIASPDAAHNLCHLTVTGNTALREDQVLCGRLKDKIGDFVDTHW
jgi:hypothetical protein